MLICLQEKKNKMKKNKNCPVCNSDSWKEEIQWNLVNPNGEYVIRYGHSLVFTVDEKIDVCCACGYRENGNPVIVDVFGNHVGKIK